ncbi:MAG: hypothetical protein RIQ60_3500 [Pseudomonadota bacterium]|jgi:hypothetical protein
MKHFLAVYLGTAAAMSNWNDLPQAERERRQTEGLRAWHAWVDSNRERIVDMGGPLGSTKQVSRAGMTDTHNALMAYTVVRAASHEEAAWLFEGHPHFMLFPGESVEVMEVLPVPPRPPQAS